MDQGRKQRGVLGDELGLPLDEDVRPGVTFGVDLQLRIPQDELGPVLEMDTPVLNVGHPFDSHLLVPFQDQGTMMLLDQTRRRQRLLQSGYEEVIEENMRIFQNLQGDRAPIQRLVINIFQRHRPINVDLKVARITLDLHLMLDI